MIWIRRALVLLLVLVAAGAIAWSLRERPINAEARPVIHGPLAATIDELGKTRLKDRFVVAAPIAGNLARPELTPGMPIKTGQVLLRIAPAMSPLLDARTRLELDNRLGASRAGLAQAQAGVQRAKLAEQDAIREQAELDQLAARGAAAAHDAVRAQLARETRVAERQSAEFAVHAASHDVAMAEDSLARATKRGDDELVITSPVDGRVLRVIAQSEGPIAPGQPLLELGDPAAIEVVAEVLTSDAVTIVPGADVSIDGWGGAPLHARVRLVEPSAFTKVSALGVEEQRVFVVMDPQERAAWAPLGDGWRVEAHVTVWRGDDVVIAPTSALFRRGGAWAAFVVDDGRARLRVVEVGHRAGAQTEITKGLAPGEQVIIHPSDRLVEGGRVALR